MININKSAERNIRVMDNLLAAHGLTGGDTVANYHGIEKGIALNGGIHLGKVVDRDSSLADVI